MSPRRDDWWRPPEGSSAQQRLEFLAAVATIGGTSLVLASGMAAVAKTNEGRIKALLWWCIVVTAVGGFVLFRMRYYEHRDRRFGRALASTHSAHHLLRDAAYQRYIAEVAEADWKPVVEASLREFAAAFSVAIGAPCHATVKLVHDEDGGSGRNMQSADALLVDTFVRSADRPVTMRSQVPENTVGRNTDFRHLFQDDADNRCWYHNDLLKLGELYQNPHWPPNPSPRNVPYRSTMVWPIRKVLREATATRGAELVIHGFLTVDARETNVFEYDRHFDLGAAYADHLLSVLWDPADMKRIFSAVTKQSR